MFSAKASLFKREPQDSPKNMVNCITECLEIALAQKADEITVALSVFKEILDSNGEYHAVFKLRQDTQQAIEILQQFEKATTIRCEVSFILCFLNHFSFRKS